MRMVLIKLLLIGLITTTNSFETIQESNSWLMKKNEVKNNNKKRVLVLNAYHEGFHWTDRIMKGIKAVFKDQEDIELFINYMDTKRCSDSIYFEQLKKIYLFKYKKIKFDAILSTDDHALDFLLKYRDTIFSEIPVVFCGINDFKPSRIENYKLFAGIHESYDLRGTIELVLELHPSVRRIVIVSDSTLSGNAFNDRFNRIEPEFKEKATFKYLTNLSPEVLQQKLELISNETAVIWSIYIRKPDGTVFTSKESVKLVTSATNQPVYCLWDVVGQGVVGGKITDPVYQGQRGAEMIFEILKGTDFSKLTVEGSPLVYKFDFNLLKQFNIPLSIIPKNSIVINQPHSFYKEYQKEIIVVISLFVFLLFIVIVLIYLVKKHKQAKVEVFLKNKHLEETGLRLKESNYQLSKALEVAQKSEALEIANKKLLENEKLLKELNEELKVSNSTKDKFFAIIAHDLRSPFYSILGLSEILRDEFDTSDLSKQKEYILLINKNIYKTSKLLENLLLWSRSQSGEIEYKPIELNLCCLTNSIIGPIEQSANNKEITIENQISENIQIRADKDMLSTVLRNLISNAIKFTVRGGEIKIIAREVSSPKKEKMIKISVKDNGVGISEKMQLKLFDVSKSKSTFGTEKETGTGIGLILCKEFIEKHNGTIWVESEKDKGSEFIFTLPLLHA